VLMLVGLHYLAQFHMVKVECSAARKGDNTLVRQELSIAHKHSIKTVQVSLVLYTLC